MQLKTTYVVLTLAYFAIAAPVTDLTGGGSPSQTPRGHETTQINGGGSTQLAVHNSQGGTGAPRGVGQKTKELACNALDTCIEAGFGTLVLGAALKNNCVKRYKQNQQKDRKALGIPDGIGQKAKELGCNALETCFEAGVGGYVLAGDVGKNCLRRYEEYRERNAKALGQPYEPISVDLAADGLPMKAIECCRKGAKIAMDAACTCYMKHSQGYQDLLKENEERRTKHKKQRVNNSAHGNGPLLEAPRKG
ncbi:uncharacterized protein PgNI_08697 [Pyricularia grisea]|uniref:Uncharacterized protein n=1 Tax=Pyricularia grisea TaxID=148305 RepID=A0A6P8AW55_PYRGI|nr:uncharacterized protein PgNI_08697 [Pyricularia grisea]TLD06458.1 hypothetical protein PgNI_08697 [Pyricularia grisea]